MKSEDVINDIIREFEYLETYGFKRSTSTVLEHRVATAFLGEDFNILLWFEYMAEDFDFSLIDVKDPSKHCQFWKLIERYSPDGFDYEDIKPRYGEPYKPKLHNLATKFEKIVPIILKKEKSELFAQ
ncbi:MAG TPA: hypothetical protein VLA58_11590 [Chitinophagaceae bacterium]|nr:hypothetical protein [Chitinophagaceae bacterium]